MTKQIVINTGPLIALERMGCLDIIGELPLQFLCPEEVRIELDTGEKNGYPRINPTWVSVRRLSLAPTPFGIVGLDLGETAVIQLALELDIPTVAIDEWKGRRMALALGLNVTGSLGLIAKAKSCGVIPEARSLIGRAATRGIRYHPELVAGILRELGEE